MTAIHPSQRIARKNKRAVSADDTALSSTITVPAGEFGVIYRLWVDLDVVSEADVENLNASVTISVTIGSTVFTLEVHPYIETTDTGSDFHRHVDLGPWFFDFGEDGFYSGVKGDNIVVAVDAAGTGIKTQVNYLYSGD
jgi:hypothetical protein